LSKEADYLELWRELVLSHRGPVQEPGSSFNRREKAVAYDAGTRRKNRERPDVLVEFVRSQLKPGETALDIGAGTGRWSVPLAAVAARVTAVEPARAMMDIMQRNAAEAGVAGKIDYILSSWEAAAVGEHDIVTCAHAMYMNPDFAGFIRKVEAHARKRCYLGIRHFPIDGIIQELNEKIYGTPHDGTNFIVAYNALYQMGIYANVLMEELQHRWNDESVDTAFTRAKRHLRLENTGEHDALIRNTLERRLIAKEGGYTWPDGMNSALVWWDVKKG
jgi:FkbM family methyltransferase